MKLIARPTRLNRSGRKRTMKKMHDIGTSPSRTKILLALERNEYPTASLLDARGLAERLDAELEVVRVVREAPRLAAPWPFFEAEADVERRHRVYDELQRWVLAVFGEAVPMPRLVVAHGDFVEQAALRCQGGGVQLIVVSAAVQQSGGTVASLARAAQVPVLASQGLDHHKPIMAATDLRDPDVPVLWHAARLAEQLRTSLVAFHNVDPLLSQRKAVAIPDVVLTGTPPSPGARRAKLLEAGQRLPVTSIPVVRSQTDPVHAILSEARALDVGLIVLGTCYRSWLERLFGFSVAGEVTSRSNCPVMVTPIGSLRATTR